MAITYVTTDQNSSQTIAEGNDLVVLEGVTLSASSGSAATGSANTSAHILGTAVGAFGLTLGSSSNADNDRSELYVGRAGQVIGLTGPGATLRADTVNVTNFGSISSNNASNSTHDGIALFNHLELLANFGTISAAKGVAVDINGVNMQGALSLTHRIENAGIIQSASVAINARYNNVEIVNTGLISGVQDGVHSVSFSRLTLINSGTISAGGTAVAGVNNDDTLINSGDILGLVNLSAGDDLVDNTGLIAGDVFLSLDDDTLFNKGDISGYVDVGSGTNVIVNRGHIGDYVLAFGGDDLLRNRGTIEGDVSLGAGDDVYDGRGGAVAGTVSGDAGNDTYIVSDAMLELSEAVGEGTDLVKARTDWALGDNFENLMLIGQGDFRGSGNETANTLTGNGGDNRLAGRGGADKLKAAGGDDDLRGGAGQDVLYGGADDDLLCGGADDDVLYGDDGNDRLIGGGGRDTLTGGAGEDSFVFTRPGQSRNSGGDRITDFTRGEDVIDLSAFDETLSWRGAAGFTGSGAGEVRLYVGVPGTRVKVDVDGNGSADMDILVLGVFDMNEVDFLL